MGLVSMSLLLKCFLVFQLSLCLISVSVSGNLVKALPPLPPLKLPKILPAPIPSPHKMWRSYVAVRGLVYCKSCKYAGIDTLWNATTQAGATVKLVCKNTKHQLNVTQVADKGGFFYIEAPKTLTNFEIRKCKMFLVSSPSASCNKLTNLNWGKTGAFLKFQKPPTPEYPYAIYHVGPFAFDAPKCHH